MRSMALGVVAVLLAWGTAIPSGLAADVDAWARRHLTAGTPLEAVRRSLGAHADEVMTERIRIPAERPLLGRSGPTVAMVVFDHAARHERLVLFRRAGAGWVIDAVVHDARVSYGHRAAFHDARYARQFAELEARLAVSLGRRYARHVTASAITVETVRDPFGDPDGVFALTVGPDRFLLRPFGGSIEDYSPARVFVAADGAALGTLVTVGNGVPRAFAHRWRRQADGRFAHVERLSPAALGP